MKNFVLTFALIFGGLKFGQASCLEAYKDTAIIHLSRTMELKDRFGLPLLPKKFLADVFYGDEITKHERIYRDLEFMAGIIVGSQKGYSIEFENFYLQEILPRLPQMTMWQLADIVARADHGGLLCTTGLITSTELANAIVNGSIY